MIPGEYILSKGNIDCNVGRSTVNVIVVNTGDRPVQIGSHFHFFEVNKLLEFDRVKAFGMRLNIASGTAVRFEPGEEKEVRLVSFGGMKTIYGINNLTNGDTNLSATFSPDLADVTIFVIDVAEGDKIPRKGGPGITRSDLLVINKIDLAPYVNANLEMMEHDASLMRKGNAFVFTNLMSLQGLDSVVGWIKKYALLEDIEEPNLRR